MLARNLLLIIVLSLMASCASSPYIQTDSDRNYDLSSYKSFKVESPNVETTPELITPYLIKE